jgi:transcriptional regulator with XRE-family HTH domain
MSTEFSTPSDLAPHSYTHRVAKKSRLKLMPVAFDKEALGQRLARIRKERGLTQKDVAERTGLIQTLVSDYERGRLRLAADMIVRFAVALEITTDELLRPKGGKAASSPKVSRKVLRRLEQIESLPAYQQRALLTTIDNFIAAAQGR